MIRESQDIGNLNKKNTDESKISTLPDDFVEVIHTPNCNIKLNEICADCKIVGKSPKLKPQKRSKGVVL